MNPRRINSLAIGTQVLRCFARSCHKLRINKDVRQGANRPKERKLAIRRIASIQGVGTNLGTAKHLEVLWPDVLPAMWCADPGDGPILCWLRGLAASAATTAARTTSTTTSAGSAAPNQDGHGSRVGTQDAHKHHEEMVDIPVRVRWVRTGYARLRCDGRGY